MGVWANVRRVRRRSLSAWGSVRVGRSGVSVIEMSVSGL